MPLNGDSYRWRGKDLDTRTRHDLAMPGVTLSSDEIDARSTSSRTLIDDHIGMDPDERALSDRLSHRLIEPTHPGRLGGTTLAATAALGTLARRGVATRPPGKDAGRNGPMDAAKQPLKPGQLATRGHSRDEWRAMRAGAGWMRTHPRQRDEW